MELVRWDSSFSVGVEEIDRQHRLLIDNLNGLYDAMNGGRGRTELGRLISRLAAYAAFHFAKEEHYFETLGYPDAETHSRQHDAFEARLARFEIDYVSGKENLSVEMMNFLCDWMIDHIKGSDRRYAGFFAANGLT